MTRVSRGIDRIEVTGDEPNLVANAGLIVPATLMAHLGLEGLVNQLVRVPDRAGGASAGRKVLTLVATMLAGCSHISPADLLRTGSTFRVLGFRVMAPSTLGTFLRAFTWGHVRQLDKVRWHRAGTRHADQLTTSYTYRQRFIALPGRLVNHARTLIRRIPTNWPYDLTQPLQALRAIPAPSG